MTRNQLLKIIERGEWQQAEFKRAEKSSSRNALKTVSAFANTDGGHIIFGVTESKGTHNISGVKDADVVQDNFRSVIDDQRTFSVGLKIESGVESIDGKKILWFYVPEVSTREKPVFYNGVPYIREGASTCKCRGDQIAGFSRDSSDIPYDVEKLDIDPKLFYHSDTLKWYRRHVENASSDLDPKASDRNFLEDIGFLVYGSGECLPSRAAVLILGKKRYVAQRFPRPIVDLQYYSCKRGETSPDIRWIDRDEVRSNLIDAWRAVEAFFDKHTDHPFAIDPQTLRRIDTSPGSIAFREATANLLIHQDYGDLQQTAAIQIFRDGVHFSNPGDAFESRENLLVPTSTKIRNPGIATGFRRIGLSEQVGFGIAKIYRDWRKLGYMPPEISIDKHRRKFDLWFPRTSLFGEEQQRIIDRIDIDITNAESVTYAFFLHKGGADLIDIMGLTGRSIVESLELANSLVSKGLLIKDDSKDSAFLLTPEVGDKRIEENAKTGSTFAKSARKSSKSSTNRPIETSGGEEQDLKPPQKEIIKNAEEPRPLSYLMELVGYKNRGDFSNNHLRPLIDDGLLEMTVPDSPTSPEQRYFLTEKGRLLRDILLEIGDRS